MSLLRVALLALAAAVAAALGPLLLGRDTTSRRRVLGLAMAFAAGMMLGIGYPLMTAALARTPVGATTGAALGILVTYLVHCRLGIGGTEDEGITGSSDHSFIAAAVHAAPEGLALGAAAALDAHLAIVLAASLALHNISESAVLAASLPDAARNRARAAGLGVASNTPQILFALAALALAQWMPALESPLLGAAFGALTYLSLAELLPDSYGRTGRTSIAILVIVAAGVVAVASG